MNKEHYNILLADDDEDDCSFFEVALEELGLPATLVTGHDGVQLMDYLKANTANLPDILFLDLNMPRKNGHECLKEIKEISEYVTLPVIIFSTSLDIEIVDLMYQKGATHYIRKPGEFAKLKTVISNALSATVQNNLQQPVREQFVLLP